MVPVYPLHCLPYLRERPWAGRRLAELYGKPMPDGVAVGESWEVADLPEGSSTIATGPCEGATLGDMVRRWRGDLVGTSAPTGPFPLLVKFIDAGEELSLQVHPSDDDCRRHFAGHRGKDECWVVVATEPGATIVHGTRPGIGWDELLAALADGRPDDAVCRLPVAPGDVVRVAPGTVHALGRGVVVLEVQQPSDSTFRLYDHGRGRDLHLAEARRVVRLTDPADPLLRPVAVPAAWGTSELLADVAAYRLVRLRLTAAADWRTDPRSVQVMIVLEGGLELGWEHGAQALQPGDAVVLPAALGDVEARPVSAATVVLAGLGGLPLGPGAGS